ncbi:MAG: hypothetical protein K0V04_16625 [Deltaproteobacteria bacterium]|nr:hypothetical protein [Deltaproteobacteria bacterium]
MTLCFRTKTYRWALLLGAASLVSGCIDPKTVGLETEGGTDGGTATGGMTGSNSETDGPATDGSQTGGQGTDGPATDGAESDGTATGDSCPPIQTAECIECECVADSWVCNTDACNYDCQGDMCGDPCMMCPEGDPECTDPDAEGICTADGACVGVPPPKQGFCEGALQPGFEANLTQVFGCADMTVIGRSATDTEAIIIGINDMLVATTADTGMPVHAEYPAELAPVVMQAVSGISVTLNECNDVIFREVEIDETWLPTAGTIIVDVAPILDSQGIATVELVDVVFEREQPGPPAITVESFTIADVNVGWLPG